MNTFGERLKELRKAAGITQTGLAETLNVHPQTVSKWERGLSEPDISQLGELAAALGVTLEKLCGQAEAEQTFVGCFQAEEFGKMLSERRAARGESQEQLAEAMNASTDAVSRWERGVTCPDIERLAALAAHFGMPVSRLYCGAREEQAAESAVAVRGKRRMPAVWLAAAAALLCAVGILLALVLRPAADIFTVTLDGQAVAVGENDWFTPATPSRDGYDFIGWKDEQGHIVSFPCKIAGDTAYTSVFEPTEYSIDYWLNGGYFEGSAQSSFTVESGALELPVPEKEGQTFEGWYLTPDYSGEPVGRIACAGADVKVYAKWSDAVFTVRYELNGGALYGENPSSVTAGEAHVLSEPVREGYIFLGWFDMPQGGDKYGSVGGENAKNLTLYALWQRTDALFTVYYDCDGDVLGENPVSVGAGEVHKLYGAEKTGYSFLGWNTRADGGGEYVEYLYGVDETLHMYAIFVPKQYVVRYVFEGDYEGEETNPNAVTFGERVDLLPVSLYGHRFLGWYDAETGGNKVEVLDAGNILTVSVLYARFEPLEFAVALEAGEGTFASGGGEVSRGSFTVRFGETMPLPGCTLVGHEFIGWNESPAGDGEFYTAFDGAEGNKTLYAVFRAKEYLIRYEYEGMYESGKVNPNYITYGERVTLSPVYRSGYEFSGWYDAETGGNLVTVIDESNILTLSRLYARFAPLVFEIALDAGEGTFETPEGARSEYTFPVAYGETFELPECTLGGYTFLGWEDENGDPVGEITSLNIRDMRLSAKWRASDKSYKIEYVLNGGELAEPNPATVLVGQVLSLNEPVRDGYIFLGWYDDAEGEGTRYIATPADRETDLTLYAVWQELVVSGSYEDFTYEKGLSSVTITGYTGPVGENVDLVIPAVVDGLPVREIGELGDSGALYDFRSVTIPEGVVRIGDRAFCKIWITNAVTIPASVQSIGDSAFQESRTGGLVFAENSALRTIGESAFERFGTDGVLVFPEGLEVIGRNACYMAHVYGFQLPATLKRIEANGLFINNTIYEYANHLYIPASVEYIGPSAVNAQAVYLAQTKEEAGAFFRPVHRAVISLHHDYDENHEYGEYIIKSIRYGLNKSTVSVAVVAYRRKGDCYHSYFISNPRGNRRKVGNRARRRIYNVRKLFP